MADPKGGANLTYALICTYLMHFKVTKIYACTKKAH